MKDPKPDTIYEGCRKESCCAGFARLVMPRSGQSVWLLRFDPKAKPEAEAAMEVAPGSPKSKKVYDYLMSKARAKACGAAWLKTAGGGA